MKTFQRGTERAGDHMEETTMTNEQFRETVILTRLDELRRMKDRTTDPAILEYIAEREKALTAALTSP